MNGVEIAGKSPAKVTAKDNSMLSLFSSNCNSTTKPVAKQSILPPN